MADNRRVAGIGVVKPAQHPTTPPSTAHIARERRALTRLDGGYALPGLPRWQLALSVALAATTVALGGIGLGSFATIFGYAALAFAVAVPPAGLALLVLLAPFREPVGFGPLGFDAVLGVGVLLGCLSRLAQERTRLRVNSVWAVLLAFGAFAAIQAVATPSDFLDAQRNSADMQLFGLAAGGAALLASQHLLRGRDWRPYLDLVIISGIVAGGLVIISVATQGTSESSFPALYGLGIDRERAAGPFNNPNYFGLFAVIALVVAIQRTFTTDSWRRALVATAAAWIALAAVLSFSRGALLAGTVGIIALAFSRSRWLGLATLLASILIVVYTSGAFYEARVAVTNPNVPAAEAIQGLENSDEARLAGGAVGIQLFARDPIFGIGFGQYHFASPTYVGGSSATYSHNWYIDVLAEQGLLGISLLALAAALVVARLCRSDPSRRGLALSVLATFAVGCLFTESPTYLPTSAAAWLVVGGALATATEGGNLG